MDLLADTNIFLAVAMGEPERASILTVANNRQLLAPEVLPYEIGNALTAMLKRGVLAESEIMPIWETVQQIPVDLRNVDIRSALEISTTNNIYAYDAYFLECAIRLRCPLITLDRRLQVVARKLGIAIPEVNTK